MTASKTGSSMSSHRVYFINKDDAGSVFFPLNEEIAHAGGTYTHKHLHEVGAAYIEKRHPGFTGNCSGQ